MRSLQGPHVTNTSESKSTQFCSFQFFFPIRFFIRQIRISCITPSRSLRHTLSNLFFSSSTYASDHVITVSSYIRMNIHICSSSIVNGSYTSSDTKSYIAMTINNSKPFRVCFSFAAYAKNLIDNLKSSNIPVEECLTDVEFSSIEATFNFTFPPDLRSILQEGLPTGPGFPNWRSSSIQQLEILTSLPILGLCKEVSRHNFWLDSWGERPMENDEAVSLAKGFLKMAPVLVPIFRNFYIPSAPCLAGNPVFYVNGSEIELLSFDLAGFFQQVEFRRTDDVMKRPSLSKSLNAPAWAATEPRRIEFWTELVERGKRLAARGGARWWWSLDLGGCLEEVFWRLRNGGWKEDDVREMMMMDGCDEIDEEDRDGDFDDKNMVVDREFVMRHMRLLSRSLLRAGWSSEDVMDSLGLPGD